MKIKLATILAAIASGLITSAKTLGEAVVEHLKQKDIDGIDLKMVTVVDEEGNEMDLDATLVIATAKAEGEEEDPDAEEKAEGDEEDDDEEEAKAARGLTRKAIDKRLKQLGLAEDRPGSPRRKEFKMVIPKHVTRVGRLKHFGSGEVNGYKADERAYRFGMWCLSLRGNANAIKFCQEQGISVKLHQESGNSTGGYLVPDEFGQDMIDNRELYGVARRLLKNVPMSSDTRTDPVRNGGLTANFVGEGAAASESTKSWGQAGLTAKKLVVLSRYTNELNEDAVISIGDDLAGEIAYAFSNKEDECAFNGDGTSTYGGITGVRSALNAAAGTPTTTSAGGIVIAAGNAYSEITLANFQTVVGTLPQYADSPATAWVMHRSYYYSVAHVLALAAGGNTQNEVASGERRPRPLFLGYPVEFAQVMPSTAANSQVCALLGDFTKGARFGDRRQDTIAFSDSAVIGGESVFERDQIAIRGTERFDVNVHDVGSSTAAGPIVGLQTLNS